MREQTRADFLAFLAKASAIVATWPAWKRECLLLSGTNTAEQVDEAIPCVIVECRGDGPLDSA